MELKKMPKLSSILKNTKDKPLSTATFKNVSDLGYRPYKMQVEGDFGAGKSHFALSVIAYLKSVGIKPEDTHIFIIDLDDGMFPLFKRNIIPAEYEESIEYEMATTFNEVRDLTDKALEELKKCNNPLGAWLIIDNMGFAWEWVRDTFAEEIYQMSYQELGLKRRMESESQHKKMPVLNQRDDYGVINPMHNNWAEKIKRSGVNFIWTCLLKAETFDTTGRNDKIALRGEGQKHNGARVEYIVRLQLENGTRKASLIKSRYTSHVFSDETDLTFPKFVEKINKIRAKEGNPALEIPKSGTPIVDESTPKKEEKVVESKPIELKPKVESKVEETPPKDDEKWE
jgi:hypothetical protein